MEYYRIVTDRSDPIGDEVLDSFKRLVVAAIKTNKSNRDYLGKVARGISTYKYLREYCCVYLNIGRRVGKTSTILDLYMPGDVIITAYPSQANRLREHCEGATILTVSEIHSVFDNPDHPYWDLKPTVTWFDDYSYVRDANSLFRDKVIDIFKDSNELIEQTFVFIG